MVTLGHGQDKIRESSDWKQETACGIPYKTAFSSMNSKAGTLLLLLETRYFKVSTLQTLFNCLSDKHTDLAWFTITAFDDEVNLKILVRNALEPLPDSYPPEDTSATDCKDLSRAERPCPIGYNRAFYTRFETAAFRYSPLAISPRLVTVNMSMPKR